jgi:carbon starvation protein CstA
MRGIVEGFICLFIGGYLLYSTIKNPVKEFSILFPNFSGIFAGIAVIVLGVSLLIGYMPPL